MVQLVKSTGDFPRCFLRLATRPYAFFRNRTNSLSISPRNLVLPLWTGNGATFILMKNKTIPSNKAPSINTLAPFLTVAVSCLILALAASQLYGCSTDKPRIISSTDLSGNWNYTPPREYWPDQKFTLKIEQRGERLAAKLIPLFKASSNAFEKQSLEGSLIGTQVYFDLRSDNKSIGTLLGTLSQDARTIVGSIQYNNQQRFVWSASR